MELTYLGHSGFFVQMGSKSLLFDPWLTPNPQRLVGPVATPSRFRKVDAIFVTHEHFDHCDPEAIAEIVGRTLAHVVGPQEALEKVNVAERLKMPVNAGEQFTFNGMDVTVTEAQHPKSLNPVGFVVECGGQRLYHAGDTYDFYGLTQVQADVGLLPIGGTYTMDVFAAITAMKRLRLKHVIPMHYGTFAQIQVDPREFIKRAETTKTTPHLMEPGDSIEL